MKKKKKYSRRYLSILLILSMLLSYVPEIPVYAAPLAYTDTTENQDVFGFTYTENGVQRNMYLYNSADGKVKLTGDILFTTGSYGYYQVRHYDGYLELPMTAKVKQAILVQHGELYTDDSNAANEHDFFLDLRILDEDGNLYSFNASAYEILTLVKTNVTKIDDVFYLDGNGKLGAISADNAEHRHSYQNGNYGYKYWVDFSNLDSNVADFTTISPNQNNYNEEKKRYYQMSASFYIKYTDDSQKIKSLEYYTSGDCHLVDSNLVIPTIDDATNTMVINHIDSNSATSKGIDESWLWLSDDDVNLSTKTPTSETETTKTYSVMDGHVTVTLEKTSASIELYDKITIQTDSTETISYDSSTNSIKTGYQDIKISYLGGGGILYAKATAVKEPGGNTESTRIYGYNDSNVLCEITNETNTTGGKYTYDLHVRALGDHSNDTYGFIFTHNNVYGSTRVEEWGEGLVSAYVPDNLCFREIKDGDSNIYTHILNFRKNRHYVYKNHTQINEYPMNFKNGETDTPYVYTSDEWELKIHAIYNSYDDEWRPYFEFSYADNAPHTVADYPYVNAYLKMGNGVKQLTDNGDGTYTRPSASNDYNLFYNVDVNRIQIGNTTITRGTSSLGGYESGIIYDASDDKCIYRAVDYKDNYIQYDIMDNGKLYISDTGRTLIAQDVVKVNCNGNYLTANGDVYTIEGEKIKENVINLTDNLYQSADGIWKYISSDEIFNLDAADEHNLSVNHAYATGYKKITYTFTYDENEITSVKDENGENVANGDTREYKENGTHTFTLTNKYGDTYTKRVIVTGFYDAASSDKANITVVNGTVTLTGKEGKTLQYKKASDENWTDYTEPFAYDGAFLFRVKGGAQMQAEIEEATGKLVVTDSSSGTFTPNDYFVNAVWDGENMRYYDKDAKTFKVADRGMQEGSIKYFYPNIYMGGRTRPSTYMGPDSNYYVVTGSQVGGPQYFIKPIYGFVGPQLPSDNYVPMVSGVQSTDGRNSYNYLRSTKSDNNLNMAYMGNYTMLAGTSPNASNITTKSEDVFNGEAEMEPVLDGSHMLELYNQTTNQNTTFVKAFMDGVYNWLVTDTGQILKGAASTIVGDQGKVYYDGFVLEEVADDVTGVDEDYTISTVSGNSPELGYGKDNAKYYLNADIEANGGNVEGVEESGDTIIASSGTGMNKRALASNGNYYVALDENNMVSYDHVTPFANQLDYEVSTTNWTNELVNVTPKIGSQLAGAGPYGTHYEMHLLENTAHPEWANATVGSGGTNQSTAGTSYAPSTLYNGKYRLDLVDNYSSKVLAAPIITINNIDTVKPSVAISDTTDNKYTFAGQDEEGAYTTEEGTAAFDGLPSAVSGIENLYYSLDNTADLTTWAVLDKPVKYTPAGEETGATDVIEVNKKVVYVYAKDNAGNMSDVNVFNIGLDLTPTVTYKTGETDLTFYADNDNEHDNDEYTYSYTVGTDTTAGYEKTFTEDTTVTIHGQHTIPTNGSTVKADKDVPIIVLKPGEPTISDIDKTTRSVTVTAGVPSHMTFKELWIKVDDGEPVKYTDREKVVTFTDYGYHTITAYQVAENTELAGGPYTFKGKNVEKTVEDPEPVTIYHTYQYEKGKTTVTFYANNDENNDDDRWTYKYTVDGDEEKTGYTFSVTENTTAELFAEVNNGGLKSNGTKTIDIYVMDAEKPQISDVPKNGNTSTITVGEIENDTLKTLEYKIDNAPDFTEINSGDSVEIPVGWHTVYAKQTTNGGIVTENNRRVYVADLNITYKVRHQNGYTGLTFEDVDVDKNPDLTYTYDIDGDDKDEMIGQGLITDIPITTNIKETDPQGNDDEDTVNLDIVKTEPPTIKVEEDKLILTPGKIENGTLINMYVSFDNENFEIYNKPIQLEMKDVTVYTYQTVKPNNPGSEDDIVISNIAQADIFKYDVEFIDSHGEKIADGYSHVVLTGTSVTERAIDIPDFTTREASITKIINNPGMVVSFVYDGNPVTVTIYHLDAENDNAELDKDELEETPLETVITASEHTKDFTGYAFKNAEPERLVVAKNSKEIRLYYEYADFSYTVHYVDEKKNKIAEDKEASATFRSDVTEKAIDIDGYELKDDAEKTINITADKDKNEIWFTYSKIIIPRKAIITGRVTDDENNPITDAVVELKKKGLVNNVLQLFNLNDDGVDEVTTNEDGWYLFTDMPDGSYTLTVSDKDNKLLAKADINVSKTGEEANDSITVTDKDDYVVTNDEIDGDRFVFNVGQKSKPVTVTIYHLDAENNNKELDKEELKGVELNTVIKATDRIKKFKGYAFKNAEPDTLTVTKENRELKLYYEYADSYYTVHYVDESGKAIAEDKRVPAKSKSKVVEQAIEIKSYLLRDESEKSIVVETDSNNEIWFVYEKIVINPPLFSMYKEIVLKKNNSFTLNLQGVTKDAVVKSEITGKTKKSQSVVKIKQQKNGDVLITPRKVGKTQVTCTVIQNGAEYTVVVDIKVLKQYKGTSRNYSLKKNGLVKTSGELPEFNVYKRIVKGKNTKIKFTQVDKDAKVKFYVANSKEAKALKIGKINRKGKTATCTIKGTKKGWVHLTAEITQNGKTYYTRLLVRIDDRDCSEKEIMRQIKKYLK